MSLSKKQIFARERKFLLLGRLTAIHNNLRLLLVNMYTTEEERQMIGNSLTYLKEVLDQFPHRTKEMENKK